jgi:hypothetical protein
MGARKSAAADGIWSCLQSKGVGNLGGRECSRKGVVDLLGLPRSCAAEMGTFREHLSRPGQVCRIASLPLKGDKSQESASATRL